MKIHELLEARKNPELNPKTSINDEIHHFEKLFGGTISFVSFTSVDKLGINPRSQYDTPFGIYAYPISYVLDRIKAQYSPSSRLPFAGDQPHATLFTIDPKRVIMISKFTQADLDSLIARMKDVYPNDRVEINDAVAWAKKNAKVKSPAGIMWATTMMFAGMDTSERKNRAVKWNKVFRDLGIDGVVDDDGDGIIHTNEPTQAVFFKKPGVIKNEKRIYNKYAPSSLKPNIEKGEMLKTAQATISTLMQKYDNDRVQVFNALREGTHQQMLMLQLLPQSFIEAISVDDVTSRMFPTDDDLEDMDKIMKFTKYIRGKRWMRGEPLLLQDAEEDGVDRAQGYCIRNMNSKRWPELERLLLSNNDGYDIIGYAEDVIKGRWTDAEAQLQKNPRWWRRYRLAFDIYDPSDDEED